MKIVSFDSECSRDFGMHCEMCTFGYVVSDENFKTEVSKQIYIKASKPTGRSKTFLRTPYDKFKNAPQYKNVRPQIASVFGWEDAVYITHSPETTFRYLCCMDRHFNYKPIRCKAFDLYTIVKNYADISSYGLSDIAKTFGIKYRGKESNIDAKTCIKILEYLCKEEHTDIRGLLAVCGHGAEVESEVIYYNTMLKIKQDRLWTFYDKPAGSGKFEGKVFSMSESFENNRISIGFRIAEYITSNGGRMTRKASESQIFVWDGDVTSKRLNSVNSMPDGNILILETNELFALGESESEPSDVPVKPARKKAGQLSIDDFSDAASE